MARQRGAVAGVLLGLVVLTVAGRSDEAAAVKAIEILGGRVKVDAKQPGKPVVAGYLDGSKVTDTLMKDVKELKSLRELGLSRTAVTGEGLKELKELKHLQRLNLFGTKVTDAGLKELKEFRHLQWLQLGFVTDGELRTLREIG